MFYELLNMDFRGAMEIHIYIIDISTRLPIYIELDMDIQS